VPVPVDELARRVLTREPRALGRAISLVERGGPEAEALLATLHPHTGQGHLVAITGPPGAGKSTLVDALARHARATDRTVGILAVDPTSPYTGGALLGDRVRMAEHYTDPGVFIRSMATRGALGGLAAAAHDAVDLLDAAGFELILIETVGVGQDEVDAARAADTVVVVAIPGMGDDIQAGKAGLFEIGDLFVLNKSDREGAERAHRHLELMLHLAPDPGPQGWLPPLLKTVAANGHGVPELAAAIDRHRAWLATSGEASHRRRNRLRLRVERLLERRLLAGLDLEREIDTAELQGEPPHVTAERLFRRVVGRSCRGSARATETQRR
jgi:LAO/AO transport system kinase